MVEPLPMTDKEAENLALYSLLPPKNSSKNLGHPTSPDHQTKLTLRLATIATY